MTIAGEGFSWGFGGVGRKMWFLGESIILRRALRFLRSPSPGRSRTAPTGDPPLPLLKEGWKVIGWHLLRSVSEMERG